jgi:hypothetical protein
MGAKRGTTIEAMSATISFIVIPTGTGTPTKKISAWSPGAKNTYIIAAAIPVITAIRGLLKIRFREAIPRTVPARKIGIRA